MRFETDDGSKQRKALNLDKFLGTTESGMREIFAMAIVSTIQSASLLRLIALNYHSSLIFLNKILEE